jgi:hydroxyacylglutathione hydrolase
MEILQLPVLRDNYIYLLHDPVSGETAVVDPAEADPVIAALARKGWRLSHIFNTHYHGDHVGGNLALKQATGCRIYGHETGRETIPALDVAVGEGDVLTLGPNRAHVMAVPGHTQGHIAFWFESEQALFCGDTLFAMGCGRLLGGSAAQLCHSLARLRQLPGDTRIFCTHEYTENNGRFALSIEPQNRMLQDRMVATRALRAEGLPTVPSTLLDELATNPFLRLESPEVRATLGMEMASNLAVFTELRRMKDGF